MDQLTDWYFPTIFFTGILGLIVAGILVFVNKADTFSSRLLAAFLACFALFAINFGLMTTGFFLQHPHLHRVFAWFSFCYPPFAYLYVRSVLTQSYRLRRKDLLLFLPAMLYMLSMVPFLLQSTEEKRALLQLYHDNPNLITKEPEGMLPEGAGGWARIFVGILFVVGQFRLIRIWRKRYSDKMIHDPQNVDTLKWLWHFSLLLAAFYCLVLLEYPVHVLQGYSGNFILLFTIAGTVLFVSIYLLARPTILYGIKGWVPKPLSTVDAPMVAPLVSAEHEQKKYSLTTEQGQAIKQMMEAYFKSEHPYTKPGYKLRDLADEINIPAYQLSAFINQEYSKNFNELINDNRVDFLQALLQKDNSYHQFTFDALSKVAGFNSRTAFIAAVKKKTGKTPSEFFQHRQEV